MFLRHVPAGSSGVRRARRARCPSVLCPVDISFWELIVAFLHNLILFSGTILPDWPYLLPSWIRFGAPRRLALHSLPCPCSPELCFFRSSGLGEDPRAFWDHISIMHIHATHVLTHSPIHAHTPACVHTQPQCCSLPALFLTTPSSSSLSLPAPSPT